MLFGDPYRFAVWFDRVESWSVKGFDNGCIAFFVNGAMFFSTKSTLGVDLYSLSKLPAVTASVDDDHIFHMPLKDAYSELCTRAFPSMGSDVEENDYTHLVSACSLLDEGHNFFLVEYGSQGRLIYGVDDDPSSVFDIYLERGEFRRVIREATSMI